MRQGKIISLCDKCPEKETRSKRLPMTSVHLVIMYIQKIEKRLTINHINEKTDRGAPEKFSFFLNNFLFHFHFFPIRT